MFEVLTVILTIVSIIVTIISIYALDKKQQKKIDRPR